MRQKGAGECAQGPVCSCREGGWRVAQMCPGTLWNPSQSHKGREWDEEPGPWLGVNPLSHPGLKITTPNYSELCTGSCFLLTLSHKPFNQY